jgi:competence protein ComEC|tara:strand:- start:5964 stop:6878 length:915 start_codon:yes stop_codon:yes gene_type:complete
LKLWFILPLLLLTACDTSSFLKDTTTTTQENVTNVTEVTPVNVTVNETANITIQEPTAFYTPTEDNVSLFVMNTAGQSIAIYFEDRLLLVDSGKESDSQDILRNIRNLGIEKIDHLILTNSKEENVGGLPYIIIQTSPANVYDSGFPSDSSSYKLYRELHPNRTLVPFDKLFIMDDVFIRMIVPYDGGNGFLSEVSDNSIITKISFKSNDFLLMSNCGLDCMEIIKDEPVDADVLVVDGSCDSTTLSFVQKVNPKAVIATGELCKETEDRFNFLNTPLYYKEKHGGIKLVSDGLNFALSYQKTQ